MKFIGRLVVLAVVIISTFALVKFGGNMFSKPVVMSDHEPSRLLQIEGSFEEAIKEVDRMIIKGKITAEEAIAVKKDLEEQYAKADQMLNDVGLTPEKREELTREAEEMAKKALEKLKEMKENKDE